MDTIHIWHNNVVVCMCVFHIRTANLSHQYYARCAYEYLLNRQLVEQWRELLQLPEEDQLLEKGQGPDEHT